MTNVSSNARRRHAISAMLNRVGGLYGAAIEDSMQYIRPYAIQIYALATIATPASYFIDLLFDPTYDTLIFRVIGTFWTLVPLYLIYRNCSEHIVTVTCFVGATILLMWMFPSMLIVNAATVPPGESMHYAWICMYLVSMFLYIQLTSNFLLSFTGWFLGFIAAGLCLLIVEEPNMESVISNFLSPFTIFLTVIVFGNMLNRRMEAVERTKTESAKAIGGNVAHELRTPLTGITFRATMLERFLPEVAEGYVRASSHGLVDQPLTRKQLISFSRSATDIKAEVQYSNTIIDMMLINTAQGDYQNVEHDVFSAVDLIEEVLERYPFPNNMEKAMVNASGEPCEEQISAPQMLAEHVLFNIIKNALFHCQQANKGTVELSARPLNESICLTIRDTGPGVKPELIPKIFDRFFTTSPIGRGSGIGLNFCRNVMNDMGGSIECDSKYGEYTEFRLFFPRAN